VNDPKMAARAVQSSGGGGHFPLIRAGAKAAAAPAAVEHPAGPHGAKDELREGFGGVRDEAAAKHPVEAMQEAYLAHQEEMNMAIAAAAVSRNLPAHILAERRELAKVRRLPVLPSSMVALEVSMGLESSIGFEDVLSDPTMPEAIGSVHTMAEASPYFNK